MAKKKSKTRDNEAARAEIARKLSKLPPRAIESEVALLGGMLLDSRIIPEVIEFISGADDFFHLKHGVIYEKIVAIWDSGKPVEVIHVRQSLEDHGMLEQVGGLDYLLELVEGCPSASTGIWHAKEIAQKKQIRDLIDTFTLALNNCYDGNQTADDVIDQAESSIIKIATKATKVVHDDMNQILQQVYDDLEASEGQHYTGIESGMRDLDDMTSGFQDGDMIIIAARPSMGKTALATTFLDHIAAINKIPIGMFSLEMGKKSIGERLLCARAGVDSRKMKRNMLSADEFQSLAEAVGCLSESPIFVDDTAGLTPIKLRALARRMVMKHKVELIIVDYLQLMMGDKGDSRQEQVSEMSRSIKALAREMEIPVLVLSQLNRQPEQRHDFRPRMSDLRESGSLEQDADLVLLLHREEYYHTDEIWAIDNPDKQGLAEIIVAKHRNGPTGVVHSQFNKTTMRFFDRAQGSMTSAWGSI